jgi:inosine/xanthosine triphosphatase
VILIFVGSTRPAKVEGVRDAASAIARVDSRFADAQIEPHDCTAVAPSMPLSVAEIIDGAERRAQTLVERWRTQNLQDAHQHFAVGVEGGIARLSTTFDVWMLHTWAVVSDGTRWSYGAGPSLALPRSISQRVAAGEELGDVIDALASAPVRGTRGAWGVLTRDLIGRRDAFRLAVIAAFAPFYSPAPWAAPSDS